MVSFGASEAAATEAFGKLDINRDGHISRDEIRHALREFYYSDDPESPGNWLFAGPI